MSKLLIVSGLGYTYTTWKVDGATVASINWFIWVDLSMCAFLSPPTFEHCQSSLSNNALSGCSFSNRHCQTMPFQGVLSPIIIVKQ